MVLAAAYGFGLASNHLFIGGNKRIAFVALATFLRINGRVLTATKEDVVREIVALATHERTEAELVEWIPARVTPSAQKGWKEFCSPSRPLRGSSGNLLAFRGALLRLKLEDSDNMPCPAAPATLG